MVTEFFTTEVAVFCITLFCGEVVEAFSEGLSTLTFALGIVEEGPTFAAAMFSSAFVG